MLQPCEHVVWHDGKRGGTPDKLSPPANVSISEFRRISDSSKKLFLIRSSIMCKMCLLVTISFSVTAPVYQFGLDIILLITISILTYTIELMLLESKNIIQIIDFFIL